MLNKKCNKSYQWFQMSQESSTPKSESIPIPLRTKFEPQEYLSDSEVLVSLFIHLVHWCSHQ